MEIERDKKFFPIPRNIDQTSIRKGLDKLFGTGKQRRLRPGEEALLLETINAYLEESLKNPQMVTYSITCFEFVISQTSWMRFWSRLDSRICSIAHCVWNNSSAIGNWWLHVSGTAGTHWSTRRNWRSPSKWPRHAGTSLTWLAKTIL
jgi:hypothetical protein